jgi:hypothetical protein
MLKNRTKDAVGRGAGVLANRHHSPEDEGVVHKIDTYGPGGSRGHGNSTVWGQSRLMPASATLQHPSGPARLPIAGARNGICFSGLVAGRLISCYLPWLFADKRTRVGGAHPPSPWPLTANSLGNTVVTIVLDYFHHSHPHEPLLSNQW